MVSIKHKCGVANMTSSFVVADIYCFKVHQDTKNIPYIDMDTMVIAEKYQSFIIVPTTRLN